MIEVRRVPRTPVEVRFGSLRSTGETSDDVRQSYAGRVAAVAAETGARFTRERIDISPLQWLSTPKALLDGRTPLDACRTSEGVRRLLILHDLSIGLDAPPEAVGVLRGKDFLDDDPVWPPRDELDDEDTSSTLLGLYTATVVYADERGTVHLYAAMIARSPGEIRRRLRARIGPLLEDAAVVRLGFDWSEPVACAMVSDAMADILTLAAEDPGSPIARGLDFHVEQRFAC